MANLRSLHKPLPMEEGKDTAAKRQKAAAWEPSENFRLLLTHIQTLPWPLTDWGTYRESAVDVNAVAAAFREKGPLVRNDRTWVSRGNCASC